MFFFLSSLSLSSFFMQWGHFLLSHSSFFSVPLLSLSFSLQLMDHLPHPATPTAQTSSSYALAAVLSHTQTLLAFLYGAESFSVVGYSGPALFGSATWFCCCCCRAVLDTGSRPSSDSNERDSPPAPCLTADCAVRGLHYTLLHDRAVSGCDTKTQIPTQMCVHHKLGNGDRSPVGLDGPRSASTLAVGPCYLRASVRGRSSQQAAQRHAPEDRFGVTQRDENIRCKLRTHSCFAQHQHLLVSRSKVHQNKVVHS